MNATDGVEARRVDASTLEGMRREGAVVYDVRPASSHRAERIAGARSLPLTEVEARLKELRCGVPLVFY